MVRIYVLSGIQFQIPRETMLLVMCEKRPSGEAVKLQRGRRQ